MSRRDGPAGHTERYHIEDLLKPPKPDPSLAYPDEVYCDGGIVGKNDGSNLAGVYAYCWVMRASVLDTSEPGGGEDERIWEGGAIYPKAGIGNNAMEFIAIGAALASVVSIHPGWSGVLYSDSKNAIGAWFQGWACNYVPIGWVKRMAVIKASLGKVTPILLQGHPTNQDLARGVGKYRGKPVSVHNRWCDDRCNDLKEYYRAHINEMTEEAPDEQG